MTRPIGRALDLLATRRKPPARPAPSSPAERVREHLAHARKLRGYSQEELAAAIGTTLNTVSRVELGRIRPRDELVIAWLRACRCELLVELVDLTPRR